MANSSQVLFDAHCHLVSLDQDRYPYAPSKPMPPVAHAEFGTERPIPTAEAVLEWMAAGSVAGAAAVQKRGTYGLDNRYILDSAEKYPKKLFPVVILEAEDPVSSDLVKEYALERGLCGVRLTGVKDAGGGYPWIISEAAQTLWRMAADFDLTVEMMTMPFGDPEGAVPVYAQIARAFPMVRIVIDHFNWRRPQYPGDAAMADDLRALSEIENIAFKFSTINIDLLQGGNTDPSAFLVNAVACFGSGRIMWGSDAGQTPGTYAEMIRRAELAASGLHPSDRRAVLHDTGHRHFVKQ
jgi:L-fuconolactonase